MQDDRPKLDEPALPDFPKVEDNNWKKGNICGEYISNINGKKYIKLENIKEIPYHCALYITGSTPGSELNILIDPASIGGKKTLTVWSLSLYTDGANKTPINLYVNGNIEFPDRSTSGNIHANIYTTGDIIIKKGSSGINFHGSLFSKEGNIHIEKGHAASEFYGEIVYAKNNAVFESPGIIMHGTSVVGNTVELNNTVINKKSHDSRVSSGSLSLEELDKRSPIDEGPKVPPPSGNPNGGIEVTPGSLHEVEVNK